MGATYKIDSLTGDELSGERSMAVKLYLLKESHLLSRIEKLFELYQSVRAGTLSQADMEEALASPAAGIEEYYPLFSDFQDFVDFHDKYAPSIRDWKDPVASTLGIIDAPFEHGLYIATEFMDGFEDHPVMLMMVPPVSHSKEQGMFVGMHMPLQSLLEQHKKGMRLDGNPLAKQLMAETVDRLALQQVFVQPYGCSVGLLDAPSDEAQVAMWDLDKAVYDYMIAHDLASQEELVSVYHADQLLENGDQVVDVAEEMRVVSTMGSRAHFFQSAAVQAPEQVAQADDIKERGRMSPAFD